MTYKDSGVDINEGERLVDMIKPLARSTARSGVLTGIGGFGASFSGKFKGMKDPVLVSSTDGVGTKLKVAFMADRHNTIGIDLVAMCVNDIITVGAEPLFFLDYFATSKLTAKKAAKVISGIAKGCKDSGCALIGGETAEMPGLYKQGEYDLAGFSVGVVDKSKMIDGKNIKAGDTIIGLASNGLHSNGYSLARKVFFDKLKLKLKDKPKGLRRTLENELLAPTKIYVNALLKLMKTTKVLGLAHITGGGLTENLPRILPKGVAASIELGSWPVPPVFKLIENEAGVEQSEMLRTFNYGIGMVVVVRKKDAAAAIKKLKSLDTKPFVIGTITKKTSKKRSVEFL
ncbi:MAG: phosphoribosylformylglycinamidine cyclo-ligase [Deltaproteobacteria bacterium]|nr:phosphoribosylformylglycinamidine cyclo-ligase [Deltaproteobacteria bacterium]